MRLPLATLEIFAAIAEHGSMRAAADNLGLKPSTVSHQLKSLEEQLEAKLFIRTTRSVKLTEAGRALIRGAGPAFQQLTEAVESARTTGHAARGTLKLAMPEFVYRLFLGSVLDTFSQNYPEIELELSLTDALSDLLDEELHAGFRLGDRIAQDMVAVRVSAPLDMAVLGSPDYFAKYGFPENPRDLLVHNCIRYRFQSSGRIAPWVFKGDEGEFSVDVRGSLIVNTLPSCVDLAVKRRGLISIFRDYCKEEIDSGALLPIFETHLPHSPGVFMYFPREYRSMMPLRA